MTREETVRNLLTELIDMIDNGSQRDLDRADEISTSIIKLFEQQSMPTIALPDIDKKVESYKELLKHPVIKSIMGMDETQEQLDFVQPHKRIPVTLTVSDDLISRQAAVDAIQHAFDRETLLNSFVRKFAVDALKTMPSVKPQERTGHWIIIDDCEKFIAKCSECGRIEDSRMISKYPYCHCGARMVDKQERSDKE
jgi:hypothetical protein